LININDINKAQSVIANNIHRTRISSSSYFSDKFNSNIYFKEELFQKTGSFKIRGVLNKLNSIEINKLKSNGIISMSSGNHAQAVAYGAQIYKIPSTIIMPTYSTKSKIEATKNYGAKVIVTDDNLLSVVKEIQEKTQSHFIHPFDDDYVIAGQGTLGLEITQDLPEVDHVFTAIGGGGLISGVCVAMKAYNPKIKLIGIEPEGADGMRQSLSKGQAVELNSINTIADGLSAPFIGKRNFEIVNKYLDELIIVSDKEIIETMWLIYERTKLFIEPSAAASLAPIVFGKYKLPKNSNPIFILCGGNVDKKKLLEISQ
tara:strand:- start:54 stop:1001 length:948 start_codon:yes stop_codon:yes gene_type:complete